MVSVSGVRGVIGHSLTPTVVVRYITAFCNLLRNKRQLSERPVIVLGRDSRVSGPWLEQLVSGVLRAQGFTVAAVGIVPTPTVQYMVEHIKAAAGIVITSSHNPIEWNGLKFVDQDGLFLAPDLCEELFALADNESAWKHPSWNHMGEFKTLDDAAQAHIDAILKLPYVDLDRVKSRKFKICLDTVNGAGGPIMKSLLQTFGAEVIELNTAPTGHFAHEPEPIPQHLGQLCASVKQHNADLGIAVDPDVDRCVLIDETGTPIGEEYTLAIAVEFILGHSQKRGPVCKNLSSSRAVDDIASKYGCQVYSTPVGEIHVAKKMKEVQAVIGGEGNGGVMLPDIHIGRDAPVAAALLLQQLALAKSNDGKYLSLSQYVKSLPQWAIVKLKVSVEGFSNERIARVIEQIKAEYSAQGAKINESDGIRIDSKDWWVHLRKSNTEPVIRVIGEAATESEAKSVCQKFMDQLVKPE